MLKKCAWETYEDKHLKKAGEALQGVPGISG